MHLFSLVTEFTVARLLDLEALGRGFIGKIFVLMSTEGKEGVCSGDWRKRICRHSQILLASPMTRSLTRFRSECWRPRKAPFSTAAGSSATPILMKSCFSNAARRLPRTLPAQITPSTKEPEQVPSSPCLGKVDGGFKQ